MEYASNGKGNLGVTLGAIGTGLGVLNGGLGGILSGFGARIHVPSALILQYSDIIYLLSGEFVQKISSPSVVKGIFSVSYIHGVPFLSSAGIRFSVYAPSLVM